MKDHNRGIRLMIVGMSVVPLMDAMAKSLGETLSPLQISFARFALQSLFMLVPLLWLHGMTALRPAHLWPQIARGLLLGSATVLFFWSLRYLPLANAIAIFFLQPLILTLLSGWFLGEQVGWHRRLAVLAGFLGALLIVKPGTTAFIAASLLPMCAALLFAGYLAVTRAHGSGDNALAMQLHSSLVAAAALGLSIAVAATLADSNGPLAPQPIGFEHGLRLLGIGAVASIGHLLVVLALQRAPASLLAPFTYIEIVAATVLGWWIFGDWPVISTWAGIAVITLSGVYVAHRERTLATNEASLAEH